jgi:hypothetical protein
MTAPNDQQQDLIDSKQGIHVVDAGAGTGKTFTVTRRYAEIVDQDDVEPEDVLLVTFTNNAATDMKDRIVAHCDYGMRELSDAPIQTFHSLCHDILMEHGFEAPTLLGIDDRITGSTSVLEDENVEKAQFREFIRRFSDGHPEYDDFFRAVEEPVELLGLINQLAAKSVFPTAQGWYRNGERHLDGDFEAFREIFDELNQPRKTGTSSRSFARNSEATGRISAISQTRPRRTKSVAGGVRSRFLMASHSWCLTNSERASRTSFTTSTTSTLSSHSVGTTSTSAFFNYLRSSCSVTTIDSATTSRSST